MRKGTKALIKKRYYLRKKAFYYVIVENSFCLSIGLFLFFSLMFPIVFHDMHNLKQLNAFFLSHIGSFNFSVLFSLTFISRGAWGIIAPLSFARVFKSGWYGVGFGWPYMIISSLLIIGIVYLCSVEQNVTIHYIGGLFLSFIIVKTICFFCIETGTIDYIPDSCKHCENDRQANYSRSRATKRALEVIESLPLYSIGP